MMKPAHPAAGPLRTAFEHGAARAILPACGTTRGD
jgi:hypothetical protein